MNGTSDLMKFRTTYLKAIAESWRDTSGAFLKKLQQDPIGILQSLGEYEFPWDIHIDIRSVAPEDSMWSPEIAGGWVGKNAVICLWLPPPPEKEDEYGRAWAAYYDEFPSYLGSVQNSPRQANPDSYGHSYAPGMGKASDFLEFSAIVMRLIALVWKNKQVLQEIQAIENTNKGVSIINKWLGFNMPWNMDVSFKLSGWSSSSSEEEKSCRWDSAKKEWPKPLKGKRPNSCRNSLQFYIPSRPIQADTDKSIEAIALSAYNLTGDQYPFTCP